MEAFQAQFADGNRFDKLLYGAEHPLADQYLTRFGLLAQPRGVIRNGADYSVVGALVEADLSDGCVAASNPDPEAKQIASLSPLFRMLVNCITHPRRHADGLFGVVGTWQGIVENDKKTITHEPLQSPTLADD